MSKAREAQRIMQGRRRGKLMFMAVLLDCSRVIFDQQMQSTWNDLSAKMSIRKLATFSAWPG